MSFYVNFDSSNDFLNNNFYGSDNSNQLYTFTAALPVKIKNTNKKEHFLTKKVLITFILIAIQKKVVENFNENNLFSEGLSQF